MNYKKDLKNVMSLYPDIEVISSDDYLHLINIHNILESAYKNVDSEIVKKAFDDRHSLPLKSVNDYFYLVTKTVVKNKSMKKVAYPMMMGALSEDPPEEFDLEKWSSLVYKIYDAVHSGDMSLHNAIDYYANTLSNKDGESDNFKRWISYYNSGEHLKYNADDSLPTKKADYQFPLNSSGFYPSDIFSELSEIKEDDELSEKKVPKEAPTEGEEYHSWKDKLHGAIRRIDKLLRQSDKFVDSDTHRELADLLHNFDLEVRSLRHARTASDRAFNIAKKLEKRGFAEGSDILMKFSQVAPEDATPDNFVPELEDMEEDMPEPLSDELGEEDGPLPGADMPEPTGGTLERALERDVSEDDYSDLEGEITIGDATAKLEEIAARLSDRRVVRNLAEFDIMLDKIGIAAMFPELAEAQSKLIDSYSYALTRVTKMLGMLASGKSIHEISDAKKKELVNKTMKEVNKTFEGEEEGESESPEEAIEREFGGDREAVPAKPSPKVEENPSEPIGPITSP